MLAGLDRIDWTQVQQAFGHGGHLPAALRGLTSSDPDERTSAFWKIDNYVVVQGYLHPAAPVVVPFLIEIADASVHGQEEALDLLYEIHMGYSDAQPELSTQARAAVTRGTEVYFRLLEPASDRLVRAAAASLLAEVRPAGLVAPRLAALAVREPDPELRALFLMCAGDASEPDEAVGADIAPLLEAELMRAASPALARAAASALAFAVHEHTPEAAVRVMLDAMATEFPPAPPGLTWLWRTRSERPLLGLCRVGLAAVCAALPLMPTPREAHNVFEAALSIALPEERGFRHLCDRHEADGSFAREYRRLSEGQALAPPALEGDLGLVLRAALGCERLWQVHSNLLAMYGLPVARAELAALLT